MTQVTKKLIFFVVSVFSFIISMYNFQSLTEEAVENCRFDLGIHTSLKGFVAEQSL